MSGLVKAKNGLLLLAAVIALFMAFRPLGDMSDNMQTVFAGSLLAVGALLGVIAIRDRLRDEREQLLYMSSDRFGFVIGVIVAAALILVEVQNGTHNAPLEATLALMVIAKLAANFYQEKR